MNRQLKNSVYQTLENSIITNKLSWKRAFSDSITKSIPCIVGMVSALLIEVINIYFIGHLNKPLLIGAVGLGNVTINCLMFSVGFGICGAIDTLSS